MPKPTLYVAITSHGFGHAVRASSVAATAQKLCPEMQLILVTTTPRPILNSYIEGDFIHRPRIFDVGVVQSDSLTMDKGATKEKMEYIRQEQDSIIEEEVHFIRAHEVGLILADIPPLAGKIAKAAEIPGWMLSNFGWDFIYRYWGEEFSDLADWMSECYGMCDRLFRLPMCELMSAFPNITDVGLTGGTPKYEETELRGLFHLTAPKEKTVLLTFGGLGVKAIPYQNLARFSDWQFITFDRLAPDLPNLCKISDNRSRPIDFMPLCGRVVSKPGYSTFAEALRLDVPIVSLTREDFAESPLLLEGIQNYSYHQILSNEDFFAGSWSFLHQDPEPPRQATPLPKDGTETIACAIAEYFQQNS